jgi:hypothetical protein
MATIASFMNGWNFEFRDIVELNPPMVSNCDRNTGVATSAMASHRGCSVIFNHMYIIWPVKPLTTVKHLSTNTCGGNWDVFIVSKSKIISRGNECHGVHNARNLQLWIHHFLEIEDR